MYRRSSLSSPSCSSSAGVSSTSSCSLPHSLHSICLSLDERPWQRPLLRNLSVARSYFFLFFFFSIGANLRAGWSVEHRFPPFLLVFALEGSVRSRALWCWLATLLGLSPHNASNRRWHLCYGDLETRLGVIEDERRAPGVLGGRKAGQERKLLMKAQRNDEPFLPAFVSSHSLPSSAFRRVRIVKQSPKEGRCVEARLELRDKGQQKQSRSRAG